MTAGVRVAGACPWRRSGACGGAPRRAATLLTLLSLVLAASLASAQDRRDGPGSAAPGTGVAAKDAAAETEVEAGDGAEAGTEAETGDGATNEAADGAGRAGDAAAGTAPRGELVVATKEAPPFAMRDTDGGWSGISISLWEALADALDLPYRFEEASLADMIDGVADGRFDASIAAMTITPARERVVDFSHPFYSTGFGIVVRRGEDGWLQMARSLLSPAFFKAIALLALLLAFVGLCFWLAEHRRNGAEFRSGLAGIGDGFWFSAVTMTTTGYGDMAPRTLAGRLVGLVWMFAALLITSTFTGMIASSLTAERLSLTVEGPADLPDVVTGSIAGSSSDDWLVAHGLAFEAFGSVAEGLDAVGRGDIDTFVYDRPLLQYLVLRSHDDTLQLAPATFGRQDYGIVLPPGSAMRESLNRALLHHLGSEEWDATLTRWLGQREYTGLP